MAKRGKKYKQALSKIDKSIYNLDEAIVKVKEVSYTAFPGTIELHIRLKLAKNQDPRSIKGSITLPHSTSDKNLKIAVAVPVDAKEKALKAGADIADMAQIKQALEQGQIPFDILLAVPQMMPELAKYGRLLGPKGLMPNPKTGTVVDINNLESVIKDFKKGKTVLKVDKTGVLHVAVGKVDMEDAKILENIKAVISAMQSILGKSKEAFIKTIHLAPTMGPGINVNIKSL